MPTAYGTDITYNYAYGMGLCTIHATIYTCTYHAIIYFLSALATIIPINMYTAIVLALCNSHANFSYASISRLNGH